MHHHLSRCVALIVIASGLAFGQDQAARPPKKPDPGAMLAGPDKVDAAAAERGQKLFAPTCGFCHGADAAGKSAPDLIRSQLVLHDEGGNLIGPVIHNGRPDRGMPAFPSLTNEQIADIAAFLRLRKQETSNRFGYLIQGLLTGNAKAGEGYFNGDGKCSTCHSPTGDLAGIANRLNPVDLQRQFLSPGPNMIDAFLGKKTTPLPLPKITIQLPSGKTVSGLLVREDEFNIEIQDSAGWHRSFVRKGARIDIDDPMRFHREQLAKYTDADMHNLLAYLETLK
ncbi:MAG TPA: c-type cytochrome [Bryobacteraceae bacterium]|jgi:cytochrome c oxidase cbb3-type subunit 3|nr:c-type cytochrome [Bryobacteraceae bacterium]